MYNFDDITTQGLANVLNEGPLVSRGYLIELAEKRLDSGELDEIELILEESGE